MRMALVGNGPSSKRYGSEIDDYDKVVRINAFPYGDAGKKWDVWASDFYAGMISISQRLGLMKYTHLPREIWKMGKLFDFQRAFKNRHPDVVVITSECDRTILEKYIGARPTGGFAALQMALETKPDELGIFGFDASTPDAEGWGHWWGEDWNDGRTLAVHKLDREKAAIAEWCDSRMFCGIEYKDTAPAWWR